MNWKQTWISLGAWFGSLFASNALVHALMASFARLNDVPDLFKWLDHHRPHRYAATLFLAYIFFLSCLHFRIAKVPLRWHFRACPRRDIIWGYRIGILWFMVMFAGLFLSYDSLVVNPGWLGPGFVTLITMIVLVSVEHMVWRVWVYENLKTRISKNQAQAFVCAFLVIQRVVFFGVNHPLPIFALIIEGWAMLVLTELLGSLGSWVFLLIWVSGLHSIFSLPFMNYDLPGLCFMEFLHSSFFDRIVKLYGGVESQWVIRQNMISLTSLVLVLSFVLVAGTLMRWRSERRIQNV